MPMTTMWLSRRGPLGLGHSPSRSRAVRIWPRIWLAPRLATSGMVPVWQKLQVRLQPTWLEMHKAPRSVSGICTVSISRPSATRSSHLRVPSAEHCSATTVGRETTQCCVNLSRRPAGNVDICAAPLAP